MSPFISFLVKLLDNVFKLLYNYIYVVINNTGEFETILTKIKTKEYKMRNKKTKGMIYAALTAALYVVLTYISSMLGLASGPVQLRISEALTILPIFIPQSVYGLFAGCIISNLLTGSAVWDIIFGSLATLIAALVTRKFKNNPLIAFASPVLFNVLIVPPVIYLVYPSEQTLILTYIGVFIGQAVSVFAFGGMLFGALRKINLFNGEKNDR